MPIGKLDVRPGWILLTAGVGGPAAKWRDKLLSKAIIGFQRVKEHDGKADYSHAELLTNALGQTFAARWRTRHRENGLQDYVGSNIMIIEPLGMTNRLFPIMWQTAEMQQFDGDMYPVWRLLLQAASAIGPHWIAKFGWGCHAICSEVVAKFFNDTAPWSQYFCKWRGTTPAMIENWGRCGRHFRIVFEGLLTEELMRDAGLPLYFPGVNTEGAVL
jgi:hypothetical protein